jgi:hypothetical protein
VLLVLVLVLFLVGEEVSWVGLRMFVCVCKGGSEVEACFHPIVFQSFLTPPLLRSTPPRLLFIQNQQKKNQKKTHMLMPSRTEKGMVTTP